MSSPQSAQAARPIQLFGKNTPASFRRIVWNYYKLHGRHDLPWRQTRNPYHILISEVMLQQTQVGRVVPFYKKFLEKFSTVKALARAPLSEVLKAWQGLGYNRRALNLQKAAQEIVRQKKFPHTVSEINALPGVGEYTARAVAAFAFNTDCVVIETNIRTAVLHHFFANKKTVSDEKIFDVLFEILPHGRSRDWYSALMDYGAYLKTSGIRVNAKSTHYTKQSKFIGSNREARGAILRELSKGPQKAVRLKGLLGDERGAQLESALKALAREGLIQKRGRAYTLPLITHCK